MYTCIYSFLTERLFSLCNRITRRHHKISAALAVRRGVWATRCPDQPGHRHRHTNRPSNIPKLPRPETLIFFHSSASCPFLESSGSVLSRPLSDKRPWASMWSALPWSILRRWRITTVRSGLDDRSLLKADFPIVPTSLREWLRLWRNLKR